MGEMPEEIQKLRNKYRSFDCGYDEGFELCYKLMKEREAKLVEALRFECGDRCAEQNPCNAKETLWSLDYE